MAGLDPFQSADLGPLRLRNRILKAATFEGRSWGNVVSAELVEFHRKLAAGGVAMTTVSYIAVSRDGMGAPAEIVVHERAADGLAHLASVVHGEGALVSAQLGHAGAVGELPGKRVVGPSSGRTLLGTKVTALVQSEIDDVVEQFANGAALLKATGFDAVELHFGHHYLVSSFLSPRWNRRTDEYGGPLENRARLALRIAAAVRDAVGPQMAVIAKMNMVDAVHRGLQIDDATAFARLLESSGSLDALELTGGGSRANQMFMFRGDPPRREMRGVLPPVARAGFRVLGPWLFRRYPYQEAYFLPLARQIRRAVALPLILLGGVSTRATIDLALSEGFEFVAMGRALLREPDLVARMQAGDATAATCVHCNKCMVSIYSGTRCVLDDPAPITPTA